MSHLSRGDEKLHYSDNSHRWIAPLGVTQEVWEEKLRAHLNGHRLERGGPVRPVPRQRRSDEGGTSG